MLNTAQVIYIYKLASDVSNHNTTKDFQVAQPVTNIWLEKTKHNVEYHDLLLKAEIYSYLRLLDQTGFVKLALIKQKLFTVIVDFVGLLGSHKQKGNDKLDSSKLPPSMGEVIPGKSTLNSTSPKTSFTQILINTYLN